MSEMDLQRQITDLTEKVRVLEEAMRRHSHDGHDSGKRLLRPSIAGGIDIETLNVDPSNGEFKIVTPDGFGFTVSYGIGAQVNATVIIQSQPSYIQVGGTASNGEVGLYDSSGSSSAYFKLVHSGNGDPMLQTDALPIINPGGTGLLWNNGGVVNVT